MLGVFKAFFAAAGWICRGCCGLCLETDRYSFPQVDRIWFWVYFKKIPIYPIFYLLKGDYRRTVLQLELSASHAQSNGLTSHSQHLPHHERCSPNTGILISRTCHVYYINSCVPQLLSIHLLPCQRVAATTFSLIVIPPPLSKKHTPHSKIRSVGSRSRECSIISHSGMFRIP